MKKLILLFVLVFSLYANANANDTKRVVFDLTTGDLKTFETKILGAIPRFKTHYEGKMQELHVAVVIHGDAYKFFLKDIAHSPYKDQTELVKVNADLQKRIATANDTYEIEFIMCSAGMNAEKLSEKDIYPFVKFVPSSVIGLIDKQDEGFTYVPVH